MCIHLMSACVSHSHALYINLTVPETAYICIIYTILLFLTQQTLKHAVKQKTLGN